MQIYKTGKYRYPDWVEEQEEAHDRPEHRRFLREAAADGIVLLKNDKDLLPLSASKLDGIKQIAFIGPNADESVAAGGGCVVSSSSSRVFSARAICMAYIMYVLIMFSTRSAALNPHYRQKPYQQFKANIASSHPGLAVKHARGCLANKFVPVFPETCVSPKNGRHGMHMEFFGNMEHKGPAVHSAHRTSTVLSCYDNLPKSFTPGKRYSYRATGLLTPKTSGKHTFSMGTCGPGRMILDGEEIINIWNRTKDSERSEMFMAYASPEVRVEVDMVGGRTYTVEVEGVSRELAPIPVHYTDELYRDEVMDGSRVGFMEEVREDLLGDAVALAAESDVVVMVVGKNIEWESEAYDMKSMDLPGRQDELIEEVLKANANTIVVNQSGSPISMPWLARVPAVVQAWYQGQELGNALFDVLVGAVNPNGKLPVTFPKRLEDTPCFHNFPGENATVVYGEGIYLGYRHYEKADIAPLFPFGHGLSYTTFDYADTRVSAAVFPEESVVVVSVDVTNTGRLPGKESVQFYVSQTSTPGLPRPVKELKGFTKVSLRPGETATASYALDKYALGYYNERQARWVVDEGAEFVVHAAASSADIRGQAAFRVAKGMTWIV